MKLSASNIAWSAENDQTMYQFLSEKGVQGLEIAPTRIFPESPYTHIAEARLWAENLRREYGLEISSMQSIWYGHQEHIFGSQVEREVLIDYTKEAILFAEAIGCKNLVFGNPRQRDNEGIDEYEPIAIDFFRAIGDFAFEHNTVVALEANPPIYHTHFINTTSQAFGFVRKVNSNGLKVNVDTGTMIENKEDVGELKGNFDLINHVHISEPGLVPVSERPLHQEIFDLLRSAEYANFVSIEMGSTKDLKDIKRAIAYINTL